MGTDFFQSFTSGKSLVVTSAFFDSDARWIEISLIISFMIVLAWGIAALVGYGLDYLAEISPKPRKLKEQFKQRAPLVPRFKGRLQRMREKIDQVEAFIAKTESNLIVLKAKRHKLSASGDMIVRQIGEPSNDLHCYRFVISNRFVQAYAARGQQHPLLDNCWKTGQLVEVWASSLIDGRLSALERYPVSLGFSLEAGQQMDDDGGMRVA